MQALFNRVALIIYSLDSRVAWFWLSLLVLEYSDIVLFFSFFFLPSLAVLLLKEKKE